jgi:hypothetical protein
VITHTKPVLPSNVNAYATWTHRKRRRLVVLSVRCSAVELQVGLDNLVHGSQEILLGGNLPSR